MRRALRHWTLAVLFGALVGVLEGLVAQSLPGESWAVRIGGMVLLDAVLIGVPLGLVLATIALFRPSGPPRPRLTGASLVLLFGLLGAGGWRVLGVLDDLDLDRLQAWHLERSIPLIRSEGGPPPIVLITLDTLRADRVAEMPRLRAWAARGAWFTEARSSSPWTLPALATLHTGLPAAVHGAGRRVEGRKLHHRTPLTDVPVLAELLQNRGYITGAVVSNPFAGARYGFARGFDRFFDRTHRTLTQRGLRRGMVLRGFVPAATDTADGITERALSMFERTREGRFFGWVHYLDAHAPYSEEPEGFDPYGDCDLPSCFDDWKAVRAGLFRPSTAAQAHIRGLYDADVAWLDAQLGRLLDGLERLGLMERALVVMVGDHGEELWDHGGGEHGQTFFDEVMRVPLLMWGPGVVPGQDPRPVGLVAVNRALLAFGEGAGLGPLAPDAPVDPVPLVSRLFGPEASGCTDGHHKRIHEADGAELFFDLVADPAETSPLQELDPKIRESLRACSPSPLSAARDEGQADDLSVLQALGYLD